MQYDDRTLPLPLPQPKKFFNPPTASGAIPRAEQDRKNQRLTLADSKTAQIRRAILENGDLQEAYAIAGEEAEAAIRKAIKKREDEEGSSGSSACQFSIDFSEINRHADKLTRDQLAMVVCIAGLLHGIFKTHQPSDSLTFLTF